MNKDVQKTLHNMEKALNENNQAMECFLCVLRQWNGKSPVEHEIQPYPYPDNPQKLPQLFF